MPRLPWMPLPAPKICLVLVRSDRGEASRSKTLSNSASEPKSHFPYCPARGFSDVGRSGPDRGSIHACLHPGRWSEWQVLPGTLCAHPEVLAELGERSAGPALWLREACTTDSPPGQQVPPDQDARPGHRQFPHTWPGPSSWLPPATGLGSGHTPCRSNLADTLSE